MPDNLDLLSEKKCKKALSKSKGELFGKKFLKEIAKENKDNKELREMLLPTDKKKHGNKNFNYKNDQFFRQGPTHNLQSVGVRQVPPQSAQGRRPLQGNQYHNKQGPKIGQNSNQNQTQNSGFKRPANL